MSASEGKEFEDPYYKLVQVYIYLYMLCGSSKMNYTGGEFRYTYRNYYEAIGEIGDGNNDVRHMRELYSHYLQEKDKKG